MWGAHPLQVVAGGVLGAGVCSGIVMVTALIDRRTRAIDRLVRGSTSESRATTNIRPLLGKLPINIDGWALSAEGSERVIKEIMERRPSLIVECGSGTSTLLMATCLKELGIEGQIISLDHDVTYAEATRKLLTDRGVGEYATVITAPLKPQTVRDRTMKWYNFDPKSHIEEKIDLLLVDGPPSPMGEMIRFPAVPVLHNYFSSDGLIILDDGQRQDERNTVKAWVDELGYQASLEGKWSPYWIVQPPSSHSQT